MNKLYAGIAAAALTATGLACTAGAAGAATTSWPDQFNARQIVTAGDASYIVGDYDTGQQDTDGNDVWGSTVLKASGSTVTPLDLGAGAAPTALAVHDDTVYAVGSVSTDAGNTTTPTLWTIDLSDAVTARALPAEAADAQSVAVSADGTELGLAGWSDAAVLAADTLTTVAATATDSMQSVGQVAFDPTGAELEFTGTAGDGSVQIWSLDARHGGTPTSVQLATVDSGSFATSLVVAKDGTSYVTTVNGDSALYAVKDGTVTSQPTDGAMALVLSDDDATAYVSGWSGITAYATDALGTYGDDKPAPYFAPGDDNTSVTITAMTQSEGGLTAFESADGQDPVLDTVTAPGAPSAVSVDRGETWADVTFAPAASSGSSAWTSTDPNHSALTYTITVHDTTNPSRQDIVLDGRWDPTENTVGYEQPLVAGDAYHVTVTATNGLFTSEAATADVPAYRAPTTKPTPPVTQPAPAPAPVQVTKVKSTTIKAGAKKLTLKVPGVTSAPGKVKVYDGKKLIGKAKIVDGKLVLKLKKHLGHGKHKLKLNYKGSAEVAKFNKTVKVKVK